jgi:5,10-methylenetetrahydrofolate reductase
MQIAARDRTRTGLQAEVLGANALGVRNMLCLSGDSMRMAPEPRGRMDIVDLDAVQMLWVLRRMRDEGKYLDGIWAMRLLIIQKDSPIYSRGTISTAVPASHRSKVMNP